MESEKKNIPTTKTLLCIDGGVDWYAKFKNQKLNNGSDLKVEVAQWKSVHVESSTDGNLKVLLLRAEDPIASAQKEDREITPDFLLIRNFPNDLHDTNFKNMVIGFMFANIPSVNTVESVYRCMERPLVHAEMIKIKKRIGDKFPEVMPMNYYPNLAASLRRIKEPPIYPAVVKVASSYSGYGKIRVHDDADLKDVTSILALHNDYFTVEPFVEHEYEFRLQKIGKNYRAFRRNSSTSWKNNRGNIIFIDHEWKDEYKLWVDECSSIFGGLDILGIDILHGKDGKDYILEINDTAPGLMFEHEEEDCIHIRDLVIERMNEHFK